MIVSFCRYGVLFAMLIGLMLLTVACFNSEAFSSIAFVSEIDGDAEIFLLEPNSGNTTRITSNGGSDIYPSWSPDRTKIAYVSDQSGGYKLYIADPAEGVIKRLLLNSDIQIEPFKPVWSPDGTILSFSASSAGDSDLYVADANVDEKQEATRITFNPGGEQLGDWSPDGEWLVFHSSGMPAYQGLWLRNPDGVNLIQLTSENDRNAKWSPNGGDIVFTRQWEDTSQICVASKQANGNWRDDVNTDCYTPKGEDNQSPVWSPDGKSLAYISFGDGNAEIYTMNSDGTKQRRLTKNNVDDLHPVWGPDGKRIAFVSYMYGLGEIIVLDVSEGKQNRLTRNSSEDHSHDW